MSKGKGFSIDFPDKWMVVLVMLRVALGRHTGMPHHDVYTARYMQPKFMGGQRALVYLHPAAEVVGDAGRVGAAHFAFPGERVQDSIFLPCSKFLVVVN